MELKHIVRRAVRRWAEKIASKRAQRQARLALPSGSDLSKRKAGRLEVAGSMAGHIGETTVAESRPEASISLPSRKVEAHDAKDNAPAHLDRRLAAFVEERYDLRHNLLTGQAEFRPKGQDAAAFLPLTARDLNSLCLAAHEAGIPCWDRDVSRFVASDRLPDYHPFRDYFDRLPPWDGEDRLDALARRVSDSALWVSGFHRWMLAVAAQWMGMGNGHANSMAPVLVSGRQGLGKSTFCRNLLPPELSAYYTDSVDVTNTARMEQLLVEMGLINLDEFDRIPVRRHPALKNVMQLTDLHVRKAYRRDTLRLPRIASFIATSNSHELLSDPSGSRRFLCVEVERPIDSTNIEHAQIYAQLKAMLLGGERHWVHGGRRGGNPACQRGLLPYLPGGRGFCPPLPCRPSGRRGPVRFPSRAHRPVAQASAGHAHGHRHAGIQPRPRGRRRGTEAHGKGQPLPDRAVGDMSQPTQEETVTM